MNTPSVETIDAERRRVADFIDSLKSQIADASEQLERSKAERTTLRVTRDLRGEDVGMAMAAVETAITDLEDAIVQRREELSRAYEYSEAIERPFLEARLAEVAEALRGHEKEGHPHHHRAALVAIRDAVEAVGRWASWRREWVSLRREHDSLAARLQVEPWRGLADPFGLLRPDTAALVRKVLLPGFGRLVWAREVDQARRVVDADIARAEQAYANAKEQSS
ncbi:MAG: hypothetical protein AB7G21_09125 [Dehalococcoidia bacterium]